MILVRYNLKGYRVISKNDVDKTHKTGGINAIVKDGKTKIMLMNITNKIDMWISILKNNNERT